MIIRNPTGRPIRLEILAADPHDAVMTLSIGKHSTVDLDKYQRALDALIWANRAGHDEADNDG